MKETLKCESCGSTWKREKSRGRKPKMCAKCVTKLFDTPKIKQKPQKAIKVLTLEVAASISNNNQSSNDQKSKSRITVGHVFESMHPHTTDPKKLIEETKNGSTWKCNKCGSEINLTIAISDIPTHKCGTSSKRIPYERVK